MKCPKDHETVKKFMDKIKIKGDGCWEWAGSRTKYSNGSRKGQYGYGSFRHNGKNIGAHRMSHMLFIGEIPEGMCVCHRCDNPSCVKPAHLFLGTRGDNFRDAISKGRAKKLPWMFGETHASAKLTQFDVDMIRLALNSGVPGVKLAKKYKVTPSQICAIKNRRSWK
jgi:hypothetical protein